MDITNEPFSYKTLLLITELSIKEREGVQTMFMEFLYFPQDKSEYIPALITLAIFILGAIVTLYLFYRKSKKDEAYFAEKYEIKEQKEKHKP